MMKKWVRAASSYCPSHAVKYGCRARASGGFGKPSPSTIQVGRECTSSSRFASRKSAWTGCAEKRCRSARTPEMACDSRNRDGAESPHGERSAFELRGNCPAVAVEGEVAIGDARESHGGDREKNPQQRGLL